MTENETLELLKKANRDNDMVCILPKSDIGKCLIKALEEIQQYRAIGTPEECRAAVEQQIPKRPTLCKSDEQTTRYTADYRCQKCNGMFTGTGIANYCYHCGQRLDWEEQL